jgi:TRAP-type mannitol/chloroaromatic compound transport system permease small subunit
VAAARPRRDAAPASALDRALRIGETGSAAAALAGGALILAAALLVAFDVIVRKLFNATVGGADELSGYALAIGSTWAFAFVMLNRGNVRIDAVYQHLPPRAAAWFDLVALLALLAFVGVVTWHAWSVMTYAWQIGSRSNSSLAMPLAIPLTLWWIGYGWFVACGVLLLARALAALRAGDTGTVNGLLGARSVREDADEELQAAADVLRQGTGPAPR